MALITALAGFSAPAHAAVAVTQEPLFITNRVKPAFVMALDDSGSMNWETLLPTQDGRATWRGPAASFYHPTELAPNGQPRPYRSTEGGTNGLNNYLELFPFPGRGEPTSTIPPLPSFGFARSHEFNPGYFNPFINYDPWARADRSLWAAATATAARVDPRVATSQVFNLTADVQRDGNDNTATNTWLFDFRVGMVIPAGTVYSRNSGNCNFGGTEIGTTGWWTVNFNTPSTANCRAGVRYYPATFFLTSATFPGYTATPVMHVNPPGGPPRTTLYQFEIRPSNMTPAAYAAAIQNFANWFSYYRNRNLATVAALTHAFVDIDFMRVGAFRINNRNAVTMFDMGIMTDRNDFYAQITALTAAGGTPNRWAIDHLGVQFRRTDAGAPVQIGCQMNAGMLFTDGYTNAGGPTTGIGNLDGGLGPPFADTFADKKSDIVARYYLNPLRTDLGLGLVRVPSGCSAPIPDPRLNCRTDPHMNFHGVTLGAIGTVYGVNTAATADPFASPPSWPPRAADNSLEMIDELWQATLTGRGAFINASSPMAITQAMKDVVNRVLDSTQPVGPPAVSGARVGSGSAFFQASFATRNNGRDWPGNVEAFRINPDGSTGSLLWSAEARLPAAGSRRIFATRTPGPALGRDVVEFQSGNFGLTDAERAAAIGVFPSSFVANFTAGLSMADAFGYLRGEQSQEQSAALPMGFRQRSGRIGSVINSEPVLETRSNYLPFFDSLAGPEGVAYRAYLTSKRTNFTPTVFVGGNAGKLHGFHADTGAELFAFIPNGALPNLGLLLDRRYNHRYFVDGQPHITDAMVNGAWTTVLLGNMGRGGRSVFALDVRNTTTFNASNVLWELPSADADLGLGFGRVRAMWGEDGAWYAVFGNGINSVNGDPVLYLVNLSTGQVVRRIRAAAHVDNGLTQIAIWDADGNGRIDTVYGGDFLGNIWKFDLSASSSAAWNVAFAGEPLFTAKDPDGASQPITGAINASSGVSGGVMLHFGTGRYLSDGDAVISGPQRMQTLYAVWDRGGRSGLRRDSLQEQRITSQFGAGSGLGRTISEHVVNYAAVNGWFIDLAVVGVAAGGERFIGTPALVGTDIVFTTSEPAGTTICAPGLRSWSYRLGRFSGAPVLDRRFLPGGAPVCPRDGCGVLLAAAAGAPVLGANTLNPQRPCRRGIDTGCPTVINPELVAATCGSNDPAAANFNVNFDSCVSGSAGVGGSALLCIDQTTAGVALGGNPKPCARQSWRQVR